VEYQVANRRPDYWVLLVKTKQPQLDLVVKLAGRSVTLLHPFDRTAFLHRLVASNTSIAMPQVIAFDTSFQEYPWSYLITTLVAGQEWAEVRQKLDANNLNNAYRQLGSAIGEIHRITFPAFGEVEGSVPAANLHEALVARATKIIKQPQHVDIFLRLLETRADLFADVASACLCHDDLHGYNILFEQHNGHWRLSTILDFDKAWAGPAESDLARLAFWHSMTSDSFWAAYSQMHTINDSFQQRKAVYQLLWCLEYAVASPQHNADTAKVCRNLGITPIQFP
jgi:aminoglycoside phosphotransferase (APT) family kinase protein